MMQASLTTVEIRSDLAERMRVARPDEWLRLVAELAGAIQTTKACEERTAKRLGELQAAPELVGVWVSTAPVVRVHVTTHGSWGRDADMRSHTEAVRKGLQFFNPLPDGYRGSERWQRDIKVSESVTCG